MLIPALLGGVVADRVAQKKILMAVSTLELLSMGTMAVLSLTDTTQLWHLAALSFISGVGFAFYWPAYSAWIPALVPESDLLAVNGFEGMVRPTIGQAIGPGLAGVAGRRLVAGRRDRGRRARVARQPARADPRAADGRPPQVDPADGAVPHPIRSALADMREGFAYMVRTPWLLATLLFASLMLLVMMGPFEVLIPFIIKDRLGGGPGDHAVVMAAFGIGSAVGALAQASLPMPRRYLTVMNVLFGVGALPLVVMGFATAVWQVVAAALADGWRCGPRRWSSGARCSSAGCPRTCWAGSRRSTSSSRSA